eukprot:1584298-Rhodomonas_salina.1
MSIMSEATQLGGAVATERSMHEQFFDVKWEVLFVVSHSMVSTQYRDTDMPCPDNRSSGDSQTGTSTPLGS